MELWDLYTENRELTGETHIRGNRLPDNLYHLVVHVWIRNSEGKFLISQRSADRPNCPLMWECVGGSVLQGENSRDGALRETKEEVGVDLSECNGKVILSKTRKTHNGRRFNDILDVWFFDYDGDIKLSEATTHEVAQSKWLDVQEIKELFDSGKLVDTLSYFFDEKLYENVNQMDNLKWLFFDIGSTLVDESKCIEKRCEIILENNNIDSKVFYDKVYELAKTDHFAVRTAAEFFGVEIPRWYGELECLYPDVENVLKTLSEKYKLGIIANQVLGTKDRLNNWGIGKYFDVIIASAEEGCEKPDKRIFELALKRANCKAEDAAMIGDRLDNDIAPAKSIGMKTIWVRQGFAEYQNVSNQKEQPDYIIDKIASIMSLI